MSQHSTKSDPRQDLSRQPECGLPQRDALALRRDVLADNSTQPNRAYALIGQVIWHSSDGLHGTVPGAKNGENRPEWRPEVSLGVTWPGVWRLLDLVVGATSPSPPPAPRPGSAVGRGNVDHARRHAVPPAMATRSSRIVLCPAPRSTPPTRSGKCWDLSDSSSSESCRQSSRAELGDLNVIIPVEEWHSSDRFGGTVRARESGHLGPESVVRWR